MSLLKQKRENDRIAAEAATKAREDAVLRELAIHPVVRAGCGRDIRDTYFYGLVFAAIADDEKVDSDERAVLDCVAGSIGLSEEDVDDAISLIASMPSPDDKLHLIEECVRAIKYHESIVKLFYAQFVELWMTGEYDLGELKEYVGMFKGWTGVELPFVQVKNIKTVVSSSAGINSALDDLATWMGTDELKHFALHRYGDVISRIEQSKAAKREAEAEAEKKRRAKEAKQKEAAKVSGFFDTVSAVVEGMGILNDIRTDAPTLSRFRSLLAKKGLATVDADKAYQAIHDVFLSKVGDVCQNRSSRFLSALPGRGCDLDAWDKEQTELFRLHCQVSWALIALCVLKKDVTDADVSQFNGSLRDAHSRGKSCHSNDNPSYFWSICLHKRVEKVLGIGRVKDDD